MPQLASLIGHLPEFKESRMVSNGLGLWLSWRGDLNPAVVQTLQDYGGMHLASERDQALWFFFSADAFLALARLAIWAKFNTLAVFCQVIPAKLLFGYKRELSVAIDQTLRAQNAIAPQEFEIWVHSRAKDMGTGTPGLRFESVRTQTGLAAAEWFTMTADPRLPYQSSLGWNVVLKPLGNPVEKAFQAGWREYFTHLDQLLSRLKCKFIIHDFFVMFPVDNLRQLRTWCKELLQLVARLKEEDPEAYWPCVVAVADRKGLNINEDLPKKMRLDWDQLVPDFPHMSFRNAYLLGEGFVVHDVRFSIDHSSMDDWCNVSLSADGDAGAGLLPVEVSNRLVTGNSPHCFYCGLRNHVLTECPSRQLTTLDRGIWREVALLDFETMNKGFKSIDSMLAEGGLEALSGALRQDGIPGILTRAIFSINSAMQLRMMRVMWLTRGKDYPAGLDELAPKDESPVWSLLEMFISGDHIAVDKELGQQAVKAPRDFRVRTLNGFVALERGDHARALSLWREAEGLSPSPLLQAYHQFLQGRLMESQGRYQNATTLYRQLVRLTPGWTDAAYRQGVCQVKMGFAEQAVGFLNSLIERDPHFFNRVLLDPELERGHIQLLSALNGPWLEAESRAGDESAALQRLRTEIYEWFPEEHDFAKAALERAEKLGALGEVNNYVSFITLSRGRERLERDLHARVNLETKELKARFRRNMDRLAYIRDEAAWFPFPRVLVDFNKDYNLCAANLNWALQTQFGVAETFKKAQKVGETEEERLKGLEGKLRFLRIVRDSTLFMLILGKTFFWLELVGLLLVLVGLPLSVYYGERAGAEWATGLLVKEKWQIQKGLILILSTAALGFAALRTTLVFDKKRNKLLEQGKKSSSGAKKKKR
ncbi:tetratricopeptide repeat protein [Oleidesulfovibrio alaskensis]|nr:tetratricopeptide repeat protein [Oleidesulfovibrio alaskensis]MBG0772089.1 tetratricopeptide repeat protein [Oleidesulfovibrio alaskensis]